MCVSHVDMDMVEQSNTTPFSQSVRSTLTIDHPLGLTLSTPGLVLFVIAQCPYVTLGHFRRQIGEILVDSINLMYKGYGLPIKLTSQHNGNCWLMME